MQKISEKSAGLVFTMLLVLTPVDKLQAVDSFHWESIGIGGGGFHQTLVVSPANPEVVYLSIDVGGIYRSDDGGLTWKPRYASTRRCGPSAASVVSFGVSYQNSDVVYMASFYSGIWKTEDGGKIWKHLTGDAEGFTVYLVAVKPMDDRDVIFYSQTGFGDGYLRRTKDGGITFENLPVPDQFKGGKNINVTDKVINCAVFYPQKVGAGPVIFLCQGANLFRSMDSGLHWESVSLKGLPKSRIIDMVVSRGDSSSSAVMYVLISEDNKETSNLWRSFDMGDTWENIPIPVVVQGYPHYSIVKVHPYDYKRVSVMERYDVYLVSNDAGKNWQSPVVAPGPGKSGMYVEAMYGETGGELKLWGLEYAPGAPERMYGRDMHSFYRSDDGGSTFYVINQKRLAKYHYQTSGEEGTFSSDMDGDPNTGYRYFSDDDLALIRTEDNGKTFWYLRRTQDDTGEVDWPGKGRSVWGISGGSHVIVDSAHKPSHIYITDHPVVATCFDVKSMIGGKSLQVTGELKGDYRHGICVSTNNGDTWLMRSQYDSYPWRWGVMSFLMDPKSPKDKRIFYIATATGIFKSLDSGRNWKAISPNIAKATGITLPPWDDYNAWVNFSSRFCRIAIDPVETQTLYAGTIAKPGSEGGSGLAGLYKSTDTGETWTALSAPVSDVWAIAVDPLEHNTVYIADEKKGLFVSHDGGKSEKLTWPQPRIVHLAPSSHKKGLIYAAVDITTLRNVSAGVFRSQDGGKTWEDITGDLPHLRILYLKEDPLDTNQIFVGTRGGGIFRIKESTK